MFDDEQVLESTFKCSRATKKAARMRRDARWVCDTALCQQGALKPSVWAWQRKAKTEI